MKRRLLIIGIDGMDREYIEHNLDSLPNFNRIFNESPQILSTSVFPPDSDTAWASIYTGINPAKHGVVDFVDPLERDKINIKESEYLQQYNIIGKTFWDILDKKNMKTCLIFPHLIFPPYNLINGFMINPHPETEKLIFTPQNYLDDSELNSVKIIKRIPRNKLELQKYSENKAEVVESEFSFLKRMLNKGSWDLVLFYSSVLDSIMHIFWNYCDPDDPTYPGKNKFEKIIFDFHVLYDKLVGEIIEKYKKEYDIMILSDHGHYRRPTNLFNINEFLRQKGYLKAVEKNSIKSSKAKLKRLAVDIAQRTGMRPLAQTILRMFPKIKDSYVRPDSINFNETVAHCTDLSGLKAYTYGGIIIREENIPSGKTKTEIINEIIKLLENVTITENGIKIFKKKKKREDLYEGEYITKYPDIVFNLIDNYGAGWDVNLPLFTRSLAHKFYPGSHRGRTPVFYLLGNNIKIKKNRIELTDVAPTVLELLGINSKVYNFDGKSIIKRVE